MSDTDATFDAWIRGSTGHADPPAPDPSPDLEGIRFPNFAGGRMGAEASFGARQPVIIAQPVDINAAFQRILADEAEAVRYPGGAPVWRR